MFWDHDRLNTSNVEVKMLIPPILFSLIFVRMRVCVCVCVCVCVRARAIECTDTFYGQMLKSRCNSQARHCLSDVYCVIKMCLVCVAMGSTIS